LTVSTVLGGRLIGGNVQSRSTRRRIGARGAAAIVFSALAGFVAVASLAWACTVVAGSTWYSDGSRTKSGPVGSTIRAYATGALQGVPYKLVLGNDGGDPGHAAHACMVAVDFLNNATVFAGPTGLIGTVTGTVHAGTGVGTYQLCFKDSSTNNSTGTGGATFTVI
jgi:hypothetical protein